MFTYSELGASHNLVVDARFAARVKHQATVRKVSDATLDSFATDSIIDHIGVLKVDTQKHDLAVLHGAERMLSRHRIRVIYVEFNALGPKAGTTGGALLPISTILEPPGFRFVASYAEFMIATEEFFATSNALFSTMAASFSTKYGWSDSGARQESDYGASTNSVPPASQLP